MDQSLIAERRRLLDQDNRVRAVANRYREWLPEVPVARSPLSGDVVAWPIDTVDLDGWFWDSRAPVRRLPPVPPGWLAMTGAMRLVAPVTETPFTCLPGPGAPFVVPRLLTAPGVVAVISQIAVGRHTGWPITYFGPRPEHQRLENLWGTREHPVVDGGGEYQGWDENTPWPPDYDFDLAPWLESEKLLWIAPGDPAAALRQGVPDCPYLNIDGPHGIAFVEKGTVRYWRP